MACPWYIFKRVKYQWRKTYKRQDLAAEVGGEEWVDSGSDNGRLDSNGLSYWLIAMGWGYAESITCISSFCRGEVHSYSLMQPPTKCFPSLFPALHSSVAFSTICHLPLILLIVSLPYREESCLRAETSSGLLWPLLPQQLVHCLTHGGYLVNLTLGRHS